MADLKPKFEKGDRVYYRDEGPDDMGTITNVAINTANNGREEIVYEVKFDNGSDDDMGDNSFWAEQLVKIP